MPNLRGKKSLILVLALALIFVGSAVGTATYEYFQDHKKLPPVASHTDVSKQPMQTFEQSLAAMTPTDIAKYPATSCAKLSTHWVADENNQPGVAMTTKDWRNINLERAEGSALWLNKTSGNCGDTIDIHASLYGVSTDTFRTGSRTIEAMRIGWYQGSGAREVWNSGPIKLKEQKIRQPKDSLRMVETTWPTTLKIKLGKQWIPGFYLFITRSADGTIENTAPFVLHSPLGSSKLMLMHSFITWATYNSFGGRSGYFGAGSTKIEMRNDRSRVVSFDRPIVGSGGFSIHRDAVSLVQFLEQQGISTDQYSDLDLDTWPSITKSYNGIVLGGHPEYFTRRIFETLISARNSGTNIAILGGNTGIWQVRLNGSKVGTDRRVVIYRNATQDPVSDPQLLSIQFADKRINVPATLLTGASADGVHVYGNTKAVAIPKWLKIPANSSINGISPDSEVEHTVNTAASPPKVHILFSGTMHYRDSPTVGNPPRPISTLETIWFTTPSGAAVFNAGVTTWSCDLIKTCAYTTVDEKSRAIMVSVTTQILHLWETKAVGKTLTK